MQKENPITGIRLRYLFKRRRFESTDYSDAIGRSQFTDTQNTDASGTQTYTDIYTYRAYDNLSLITGETVDYRNFINGMDDNEYMNGLGTDPISSQSVDYESNYDGAGQQIRAIDANGSITKIHYDILGRQVMIETPFDADGGQTIYTKKKIFYDAGGRVVEEHQQNNAIGAQTATYAIKKYAYDDLGRLIKTEQVVDATHSLFTQQYYDSDGRLRRVYSGLTAALSITGLDSVSANGDNDYSTTKYTYDFYGRLTGYTDGLDNTENYSYLDNTTDTDIDLTGHLNKKTLRNGNTFTYTYDCAGNVTEVIGEVGSTAITLSYTYDLAGNLLTADDGTGSITYEYDNMGRCVTETDVFDSTTYVLEYEYLSGEDDYTLYVSKMVGGVPDLEFVQYYGYWQNRLMNTTIYNGDTYDQSTVRNYSIAYYYDKNGNLTDKSIATYNGMSKQYTTVFASYDYNLANCITQASATQCYYEGQTTTVQFDETVQYSLDGNMTARTTQRSTGNVEQNTYAYDGMGRLTSELFKVNSASKWQKSYTLDDYSNVHTIGYTDYVCTNNNTTTTYTHNKANQLTEQLIQHGSTTLFDYTFEYDDAGNLTTKKNSGTTQMTYTYDELNRMDSSLPAGGTETSYTYNAAGQRIAKQTGTTTTRSLWSGGKIIEDFVTAGSTTTKNVYVQGLVTEGVIKPYMYNGYESYTNFYVNSYNAAGDVAATWLINTGNAPSAYNYDAYGSKTGGGALPSPYSYSGYYSDSETGFFYLNARYYDPATQRFTQEDTYWGDGPNLYLYCSGNPVMFTDPTGHFGGRKMMLFEDRVSGRKVKTPAPTPEPISTPAPTPTKTPAGRPIPSSLEKHYKAPPAPNKRGEISLDGKKYENGKIPNSALVEVQKGIFLESDTAKDFIDMYKAAESGTVFDKRTGKEVRLNMVVFALSVGYRSYAVQEDLYNRRITDALPGQSMHGLGVAIDLTTSNGSIDTDGDGKVDIIGNLRFAEAQIPEVMWMEQHAHEFNFYPYLKSPLLVKSKQSFANGVDVFYYNEPWHWNHLP